MIVHGSVIHFQLHVLSPGCVFGIADEKVEECGKSVSDSSVSDSEPATGSAEAELYLFLLRWSANRALFLESILIVGFPVWL